MRDGWSIKRLVRALVLSRAYQLGSRRRPNRTWPSIRPTGWSGGTARGGSTPKRSATRRWPRPAISIAAPPRLAGQGLESRRAAQQRARGTAAGNRGRREPASQRLPAAAARADAATARSVRLRRARHGHRQPRHDHRGHAGAVPAERSVRAPPVARPGRAAARSLGPTTTRRGSIGLPARRWRARQPCRRSNERCGISPTTRRIPRTVPASTPPAQPTLVAAADTAAGRCGGPGRQEEAARRIPTRWNRPTSRFARRSSRPRIRAWRPGPAFARRCSARPSFATSSSLQPPSAKGAVDDSSSAQPASPATLGSLARQALQACQRRVWLSGPGRTARAAVRHRRR